MFVFETERVQPRDLDVGDEFVYDAGPCAGAESSLILYKVLAPPITCDSNVNLRVIQDDATKDESITLPSSDRVIRTHHHR